MCGSGNLRPRSEPRKALGLKDDTTQGSRPAHDPRPRSPHLVYLDQLQAAGLERFEMDCQHCPRRGRYRIASLIERFGADVLILEALSADCPRRAASPNPYHRCGARSLTFRDFARLPRN